MTVTEFAAMLTALPPELQGQSVCIFKAGLPVQLRGLRPVKENAHGTGPAYVEAVTWMPPSEPTAAAGAEKGAPKK